VFDPQKRHQRFFLSSICPYGLEQLAEGRRECVREVFGENSIDLVSVFV
jgi:hypothetical protein